MPYVNGSYRRENYFGRFYNQFRAFLTVALIFIVFIMIVGGITLDLWSQFATRDVIVAKIVSTEIKRVNNEKDTYLVNVEYIDGTHETLSIQDSFINGNFTSADKYFEAKVNIGHTYKLNVYGWRNGFMSWFRVIYAMQKIE